MSLSILEEGIHKCDKCKNLPFGNVIKYFPIISFGNPENKQIIVVGLNPSNREYEDNYVSNSHSIMERHTSQMRYFDKTPYTFFKHIMKYFENPVKSKLGWIKTPWEKVGYLDIVKCPVRIHAQARSQWGSLSKKERRDIISNCSQYLVNQLEIFKPKLIMAYGADVCRWFYTGYTSKDAFTVTKSSILQDYDMMVILVPQTRGSHPKEIIDTIKDIIFKHL